MTKFHKKIFRRRKDQIEPNLPVTQNSLPKITTETVEQHREEVLKSARKYIYPLQHSIHKIVVISTGIFLSALIVFFSYTLIGLYRLNSVSTFLYRVTQVLPLPVAYADGNFVAYENYLFELRRSIHYYQNQQKLSLEDAAGREQLIDFKKRALDKAVNDTYIRQIAAKNRLSVSVREVEDQLAIEREQNRFGDNQRQLEVTLKEFFGWSIDDFKRTLKQRLLEQKVVAALDKETPLRAENALAELKAGADFGLTAAKYSDDLATKTNGGDFGFAISKTNPDILAQTIAALYSLPTGQVSDIINVGYSLEIIKNLGPEGDKLRGAHILFNFKDISAAINDQKEKDPARLFIKL